MGSVRDERSGAERRCATVRANRNSELRAHHDRQIPESLNGKKFTGPLATPIVSEFLPPMTTDEAQWAEYSDKHFNDLCSASAWQKWFTSRSI